MEILFKGFIGTGTNLVFGWLIIVLGVALCIGSISLIRSFESGAVMPIILVGILLIVLGFVIKSDNRIPIIKATINESVSWQEINNKYKLREQTGKIYTFEVKDMSIKEWEGLIERENEE